MCRAGGNRSVVVLRLWPVMDLVALYRRLDNAVPLVLTNR